MSQKCSRVNICCAISKLPFIKCRLGLPRKVIFPPTDQPLKITNNGKSDRDVDMLSMSKDIPLSGEN